MTILNSATRVDYKVYVAGVLVPCSNVVVSSSASSRSSAQFSLPAHPLLLGLGKSDRLQVAIFYLDSSREDGELQWCLLFEGYLGGQSYVSSPTSREVTFFAFSNLAIWDNLYLEFLGGKGKGKVGKADKVTPDEITMKGNFPRRFFTEGLDNKVYIKRAFDLVGNIFLATTGRFLDRDIASKATSATIDKQIERTLGLVELNRDRQLAGLDRNQLVTRYKEIAREQLQKIKGEEDEFSLSLQVDRVNSPSSRTDINELSALIADIDRVIIRSQVKKNVGKRNTLLRTPANTGFFARYFNITKLEQHFVACPILEGYPDEDVTKLPTGMFPLLKTPRGKQYMRAVARQTGRKFGPNGNVSGFISNLFGMMNYQITDILAPPIYKTDKNGLPKAMFDKTSSSNRIAQHITMPLATFALTPTFNTILPCMIKNWSYSDQYGAAPTRLYYERSSQGRKLDIKSSNKGYADHGTHVGYPAVVTRHAQDASNKSTSDLEVLVFPEEYYRGPNSVFTQINPLLRDIKKLETAGRLDSVEQESRESKDLFGKDPIPADQLNYLEEALISAKSKGNSSYALFVKQAQVDYTIARTQGTSFSVNTVFNPNIVAGLPTTLFDSFESNCHMVGYVQQVNHTLSQGQSSTTVTVTSARPLRSMLRGILNQGSKYSVYPAEPLTEIRELFQVEEPANYIYGNLFYRNSSDADFNAAASQFKQTSKLEADKRKLQQDIEALETEVRKLTRTLNDPDIIAYTPSSTLELMAKEVEEAKASISTKQTELSEVDNRLVTLLADRGPQSEGQATYNYVLNWKELVDIVTSSNASSSDTTLDLTKFIGRQARALSIEEREDAYQAILRGFIRPKDRYEHIFYSLPVAQRFISRPVCTLEEYIDFYSSAPDFINPDSQSTGGRGRGVRGIPQYLDGAHKVAKHYRLIREFVGGPGFEPGSKVSANNRDSQETDSNPQVSRDLLFRTADNSGTIINRVFASLKDGDIPTIQDLPDLADDAQETLLLYADIIKSRGKL